MGKLTMSVKEVASELGVSATTIYTMAREKEIPHTKVRGEVNGAFYSTDQQLSIGWYLGR